MPPQDKWAQYAQPPSRGNDRWEEYAQSQSAPRATAIVSSEPSLLSAKGLKQAGYNALDATLNSLPGAGGMIGGLLGGIAGAPGGPPGAVAGGIAGAAVGGSTGALLRQMGRKALGWEVPPSAAALASDVGQQGAIQGAIQAGGEAIRPLEGVLGRAAETQYERVLAPTTQVNKALAKKIVPELLDRGVVATSREGLENRAAEEAAAIRPQLDAAYNALPSNVQLPQGGQGVLSSLDRMKERYIVDGKVANPQAVQAIEGVQDVVRQFGSDISPKSLRQLKAIFDEPVAAKGGYAGSDLATKYALKAQKAAAGTIRDILHQQYPDIAALDKEANFWLNVQRVIGATNRRMAGQSGGLLKVLTPLAAGGAAGVGLHYGGAATIEAGGTAAAVAAVAQMVRSPLWRTMSAVAKDRLAESLATGSVVDVLRTAARFGLAGYRAGGHPASTTPKPQQ